jgi:hypothetical protein
LAFIIFMSESRLCINSRLSLWVCPSLLLHVFHGACINRILVIWPTSFTKYPLSVTYIPAEHTSLIPVTRHPLSLKNFNLHGILYIQNILKTFCRNKKMQCKVLTL